ncbi:hypothetical protein [Phyllobacterium lublinensis]|uniref:hypothetical protein n=1 Tax=Phyllobacterium lublinensis TaxID=2875708 RepID=UPI001CC99A39|nr:hypothetical protein [Phyllobacterium sp. 2063]MBZ9656591.1 hypothetical protein [Phyllobacterium sp. 2063]
MTPKRRSPELSELDTLTIEAAIIRQQMDDLGQKVRKASLGRVMDDLMADLIEKIKLMQIELNRCEIEQLQRVAVATTRRSKKIVKTNPKGLSTGHAFYRRNHFELFEGEDTCVLSVGTGQTI